MSKVFQIALLLMATFSQSVLYGQKSVDEPTAYPDPQRFEKWITAFVEADKNSPLSENGIVATGSSSMVGWHKTIHDDLEPLTIIPRGFGGSNMNDVLYYVDEVVIRHKPRAVLLYEGDNDVAAGINSEKIIATFILLKEKIHSTLPETRIYVLSVKPSISRWAMWPRMQEVNRLLKAECEKDPNLTFIDIASTMLNDKGEPIEKIFVKDMLHMNDMGYRLWSGAVKPVLVGAESKHEL